MLAITGLVLCLDRNSGPPAAPGPRSASPLVPARLVAPTSASGRRGTEQFVSGPAPGPGAGARLALLGSGVGQRAAAGPAGSAGLLLILAPVTIAFGDGWDARNGWLRSWRRRSSGLSV